MKIGFALIPEPAFLDILIDLEHRFHEAAGFLDRLGTDTNLPHLTLFQGTFTEDTDYRILADELARTFVKTVADHSVFLDGIIYVPEGWYFLEAQPDFQLTQVHEKLLEQIRPYLLLDPGRLDRNLEILSLEQVSSIREFGYRYAGKAFYPHITIGRALDRKEDLLEAMNAVWKNMEMEKKVRISRITVYQMGSNGTHERTLYEADLSSLPTQ